MSKRRRRPMPVLRRGSEPGTPAPAAARSAVAEHLLQPGHPQPGHPQPDLQQPDLQQSGPLPGGPPPGHGHPGGLQAAPPPADEPGLRAEPETRAALVFRAPLPAPARMRPPPQPSRPAPGSASGGAPEITYTVRPGDTVVAIARRCGVAVTDVIDANGLGRHALVRPGQRLVLPAPDTPEDRVPAGHAPADRDTDRLPSRVAHRPGPATPLVYVVRPGDTVADIAHRHGIRPRAILHANRLDPRGFVRPGRRLLLPGARSADAPAAEAPRGTDGFLGSTYPEAVTRAAAVNRATLAHRQAPTSLQVQAMVVAAARRYGVDPALALAVAYQESGFDQRRVSPANAIGVMQVVPSSGSWASTLVGRRLDLLSAEDNVTAGVAILSALLAAATEPTAVAGYYQGLASVQRSGMLADTRRYVAGVRTLKARFR